MSKAVERKSKVDTALINVTNYKMIYKVLCDNKTPFIQRLRRDFRNTKSEMIFGKYKMVEKVLSRTIGETGMEALKGTNEYKLSNKVYMYILSDHDEDKIRETASKTEYHDYERRGEKFAEDIILPKGELLNRESVRISNTLFKDIQKIGLVDAILNPKTNSIELAEDVVLARKGEEITEDQEKMLRMLGIRNKIYEVVIVGRTAIPQ
ncbi:mRNA turnover protein 4 [Nematocida displodere]|uniref:mRNA turnover protein 4 n=1 Tax=Nematocida displodere TaxID=1805483 RepID=A0A177EIU6_9MICR|nr:mRNA turnover protein 4 [Nematocida displodere]